MMSRSLFVCLALFVVTGCSEEIGGPSDGQESRPSPQAVESQPQGLVDRFDDGVHLLEVQILPSDGPPVLQLAYTDADVSSLVDLTGVSSDDERFADFVADMDLDFLIAVRAHLEDRAVPADATTQTLHQIEVALMSHIDTGPETQTHFKAVSNAGRVAGRRAGAAFPGTRTGFWCELGCNAAMALCSAACGTTGPAAYACILACTTAGSICIEGC